MKATKQYFPLVLFVMLSKVVLTFVFVDEALNCMELSTSMFLSYFPLITVNNMVMALLYPSFSDVFICKLKRVFFLYDFLFAVLTLIIFLLVSTRTLHCTPSCCTTPACLTTITPSRAP